MAVRATKGHVTEDEAAANTPATVTPTTIAAPAKKVSTGKSAKTYKAEAATFIEKKDYSSALHAINDALLINGSDAEAWATKASIHMQLGDLEAALSAAKDAVKYAPTNTGYWKLEIDILRQMESKKGITTANPEYRSKLEPVYVEALAKTSNNIEIIMPYAIFLEEVGDKQMAITYWQKAIEVNPAAKSSYEANIARLQK